MQEYARHIARWMLSIRFEEVKKTSECLYPEGVPRNRQKFEESL